MTPIPHLSSKDIEEHLNKLYERERKHHLFAVFGAGENTTIEIKGNGRVFVCPVTSELELREQLAKRRNAEEKTVYLVPFKGAVPLDIAGLFAKNGRVFRIGKEATLKRIFRAVELDEKAQNSHLGDYLVKRATDSDLQIPSGRLTLEAMWSTWLCNRFGLKSNSGLALDTLLAFAVTNQQGPAFIEIADAKGGEGLRTELSELLRDRLGSAGPTIFSLWESGEARRALELGVLYETLLQSDDRAVQMWVRQSAKTELSLPGDSNIDDVIRGLAGAAGPAFGLIRQNGAYSALLTRILDAADARLHNEPEVQPKLIKSIRLPSAWQLRFATLGKCLETVVSRLDVASVNAASSAFRDIERHMFFQEEEQAAKIRRAEMAVRLASWLVERRDKRLCVGMTQYARVEELGRWYVEEGGYVDLARRIARGSESDDFGRGVMTVVRAADVSRQELDRQFAAGLSNWYQANCPASHVVPMESALTRIAVKFLEEDAERRLLVLLLDGMAWAQAVELLGELSERAHGWAPIQWLRKHKVRIGDAVYPPVLATVPSETKFSRRAFFSGKEVAWGSSQKVESEAEGFASNKGLLAACEERDYPRLFVGGDGHTTDGTATKEALAVIGDTAHRVVGIVVNAIDASLHGDSGVRHEWTSRTIRSLEDILEKAREANRTVLLASDHGHVSSDLFERISPDSENEARWRPWDGDEKSLREFEVGILSKKAHAQKDRKGLALIADDAHTYGGIRNAGQHGGATLSEIVIPCVLLGVDDEVLISKDEDLRQTPPFVPGWWHFDIQPTEPVSVEVVEQKPPRKRANENQLSLFGRAKAEPSPKVPVSGVIHFASSELLQVRAPDAGKREKVIAAVEFLLSRDGIASESAFATALGELRWRVGGLISVLQEVLNVDGYQILVHERQGQQVRLDKEQLCQQFEVVL